LPAINSLLADLPRKIAEYEAMLLENEILIARAKGVGVVPQQLAIDASLTGPMIRGCGVPYDVRKADPYAVYDRFDFAIPVGEHGDSYDRFLVRMAEMKESLKILNQAVPALPGGPYKVDVPLSIRPPVGDAYARVESPKGELGYYIVSDGGTSPYRFHVRAPSYINLSVLREMVIGRSVADSIVSLGSIDIVIGEVDR
jgi:NADH-quinone oxidoreductase subunit D